MSHLTEDKLKRFNEIYDYNEGRDVDEVQYDEEGNPVMENPNEADQQF